MTLEHALQEKDNVVPFSAKETLVCYVYKCFIWFSSESTLQSSTHISLVCAEEHLTGVHDTRET